jgi:hypothetical protein
MPLAARTLWILFLSLLVAGLAAQAKERAVTAPPSGRIEGRVLGPLGEPMAAVAVWAAIPGELDRALARGLTDGEGYFVLTRLPAGLVSVLARAEGLTMGWATVSLAANDALGAAKLRLWPATTIRGRVIGADGTAIANAQVLGTRDYTWFDCAFRSPEATTDGEGRFELHGVPIGDQVLRAWKDGFVVREDTQFAVVDRDVELVLARGAGDQSGVQLQVRTEGVARELAPKVQVSLYPTRSGSGFAFLSRMVKGQLLDVDGRWSVAGLPDCEWHVSLVSDDYAFAPREFSLSPGQAVHEMLFAATPYGALSLRGSLKTPDGAPLAGQRLVCHTQRSQSMNGGRPGACITDAEGRFELQAPLVAEEPYTLHLSGSRHVLQQQKSRQHKASSDARFLVRYEDTADASRELALVAVEATVVRARIVDAEGTPVAFRWCELQVQRDGTWDSMAYATSRRDGTLVFPGVHRLAAQVRIEVGGQAGAVYSEPFRLDTDAGVEQRIVLPKPGSIVGRLYDAAKNPMPGVRLMIQHFHRDTGEQIDGSWTNVTTDRDGRYAFVGVAPVGHRLRVYRGDTSLFTTEMVVVDEGKVVAFDVHFPADVGW